MPAAEVPQEFLTLAQARAVLESCPVDQVIERWLRLGQALDARNRLAQDTCALLLLRGVLEENKAADLCGQTARALRRRLSDLMEEHFDMSFGAAMALPAERRARLAEEIETAQRLRESRSGESP